jgi:hypothetical protein
MKNSDEMIKFFSDFGQIGSIGEWLTYLISLILLILPLVSLFRKILVFTTMDDFEKLILEKRQKIVLKIIQSIKEPLLMQVFYTGYALFFVFVTQNVELGFLPVNTILLLVILIFLSSFLILLSIIVFNLWLEKNTGYKNFLNAKRVWLFKKSIIEAFAYTNSVTGLFFYTIAIYYLLFSNKPGSFFEITGIILIPILLFYVYKSLNKKVTTDSETKFTFKIIESDEIKKDELIFLYNIDSARTVLTKSNKETIRILYNSETNSYYEFTPIN